MQFCCAYTAKKKKNLIKIIVLHCSNDIKASLKHKFTWKTRFTKFYVRFMLTAKGVIKINMRTINISCNSASKVNLILRMFRHQYWKTRQKCWLRKYFFHCIQLLWMQERPDSSSGGLTFIILLLRDEDRSRTRRGFLLLGPSSTQQ